MFRDMNQLFMGLNIHEIPQGCLSSLEGWEGYDQLIGREEGMFCFSDPRILAKHSCSGFSTEEFEGDILPDELHLLCLGDDPILDEPVYPEHEEDSEYAQAWEQWVRKKSRDYLASLHKQGKSRNGSSYEKGRHCFFSPAPENRPRSQFLVFQLELR